MRKTIAFLTLSLLLLSGCGPESAKKSEKKRQAQQYAENLKLEQEIAKQVKDLFKPLPLVAENPDNPLSPEKVHLGKMLYFDVLLSNKKTQSCNTCHDLSTFGVDNKVKSPGDEGLDGDRNSPSVLNAALHISQFWDGRTDNVEEQAGMPILESDEMNMPSEEEVVKRIRAESRYQQLFNAAFPDDEDPVTYANLKKAIGAFERTLITPSGFDEYLNEISDLTLEQKYGLKTFIGAGCVTCHSGSLLGGNMMHKFGVYADYWDHTKSEEIDEGLAKETKKESDKYMFKVPSLRNVEMTFPYFHDGSVSSLDSAIQIIARVNLNRDLTQEEVIYIIAFLETLTGEVPADALAE